MQQLVVRRRWLVAVAIVPLLLGAILYTSYPTLPVPYFRSWSGISPERSRAILEGARSIIANPPPSSAFGERGLVSEKLAHWHDETHNGDIELRETIEKAVSILYPFLLHPSRAEDKTPLTSLRRRQIPGSRGIVITVGRDHFRYATHLIANIRDVLGSSLPIEIAYAGDDDLPDHYRTALQSLGNDISFLDVLSVFSDDTLDLLDGKWAVKSFAVLASRFEETISLDADTVFLQKPEVLLDDHEGYRSTGALLFHDRLLWQNVFKDRTKWWHEQMGERIPSAALNGSKVWTENYAEEGDSGVIVVNKESTLTMLGLLHIAWQNSKEIRDEWTYKLTYGDKESWWFGLELTGVPFAFEEHYGGVLGELGTQTGQTKICGFTIAHLDEHQRLIWFNGSLLKNKAVNALEYWVPSHYMVDGTWAKGNTKADMSCMAGGEPRQVDVEAEDALRRSVEKAKKMDEKFKDIISQH